MSKNERIGLILCAGLFAWLLMAANNDVTIRDIEYNSACVEIDARNTRTDFLLSYGDKNL